MKSISIFLLLTVTTIAIITLDPKVDNSYLEPPFIDSNSHLPEVGPWWESVPCKVQNETLDVNTAKIINKAQVLAMINPTHSGALNLGQICDLFDVLTTHWNYSKDISYFGDPTSADQALHQLYGDYDDFAILIASAIHQIGGLTRIVTIDNRTSNRSFAQVYIGRNQPDEALNYLLQRYNLDTSVMVKGVLIDNWGNYWLNLDPIYDLPGETIYHGNGKIYVLGRPDLCLNFPD